MSLYKRGNTYYADIRLPGRERIRESTGTSDEAEAWKVHDRLKAALWDEPDVRPEEKTWEDACVAWLSAAERSMSDRYSLRALGYKDRPLSECQPETFYQLSDKSSATYNRYRAIINAILNHAQKLGWVESPRLLPAKRVKAAGFRFLTRKEWEDLRAALPPHLLPMAEFALYTGLRQHNVTHLKWENVNLEAKLVWVMPEDAKSNKPIGIPLSDDAAGVLQRQLDARNALPEERRSPYVFTFRGKPIAKIKTAWNKARERAGLGAYEDTPNGPVFRPNFRWHDFRHTFASWHIMSGTPLQVLRELGGWADARMVERYAHLAPSFIASYANNARPFKGI